MNISEKIIAISSGRETVAPGEIVNAHVDAVMVNDLTGPLAVESFRKIGIKHVWNSQKAIIVLDHQVPANSVKAAELHETMRDFACAQGIRAFYDVGRNGGVCHQVMAERGHAMPGTLIVGADSHTCTYGAFGAFATGIGSTEAAAVFATGRIWLKVPAAIKINVNGRLQRHVTPKDVILSVIGKIRSDGASYKSLEFSGETVTNMSVAGRMTLCNMAVEAGAKNGIVEPDERVLEFLRTRTAKTPINFEEIKSDGDSVYDETLDVWVDSLVPQVSFPPSVDNVKPASKAAGVKIDQAFIGSCTNGRMEDLRLAAEVLRGKKIRDDVRMLVIPASQEIYLKALKEGLLETFINSGAIVCNPTCGPCLGGHLGVLAPGEVCISSSNRNFVGRMGSPQASIYLASPPTVAASALTGQITDPREMEV